jgi:hypothetical protein
LPEHIGKYSTVDIVVARFQHGAELYVYLYELIKIYKISAKYEQIFNEACARFKIATPGLFQLFVDLCLKISNDEFLEVDLKFIVRAEARAMQRLRKAFIIWYLFTHLLMPMEEQRRFFKYIIGNFKITKHSFTTPRRQGE